jgi:predicted transcriptional regulator
MTTGDDPKTREYFRLVDLARHPSRGHVLLALLARGGLAAAELVPEIGLNRYTLTHELSLMKSGGVIEGTREGKQVRYALTPDGVRLARLVARLAEMPE